ncbi:hypothetical protein NE865_11766 [Phthorimaea operculella]|nr:hypothetical protein NE865_11766 [Phthorimaea operculella]
MILSFVLLLFGCAYAQYPSKHFSQDKKMTLEDFRKIPDDPMELDRTDTEDIPPAPKYLKTEDSPAPLRSMPKNLLPRDQYLEEMKANSSKSTSNKVVSMLLNFQQIHDKVIEEQSRQDPITRKPFRLQGYPLHVPPVGDKMFNEKMAEFEPHSFVLKSDSMLRNLANWTVMKPIVWSTCEDFKRGSRDFNPDDIVNIVWIPFYNWAESPGYLAHVHKFTVPTQLQVYEYQKKFGPYLNRSIDWTQPKLYFEQDLGTRTAMLVAADMSGAYYLIFDVEVPEYVQQNKIIYPLMLVRLKIVGQYLAMMYCQRMLTLIMAREGHVPPTNKEKRVAAKILNFRGKGRPVVRDEEDEQARWKTIEYQKKYLEALMFLPSEPGAGYFDALTPKETPTGRRHRHKGQLNFKPEKD